MAWWTNFASTKKRFELLWKKTNVTYYQKKKRKKIQETNQPYKWTYLQCTSISNKNRSVEFIDGNIGKTNTISTAKQATKPISVKIQCGIFHFRITDLTTINKFEITKKNQNRFLRLTTKSSPCHITIHSYLSFNWWFIEYGAEDKITYCFIEQS